MKNKQISPETHAYRHINYAPLVDHYTVLIPKSDRPWLTDYIGSFSTLDEAISARDQYVTNPVAEEVYA